jgi:hypothetical protein
VRNLERQEVSPDEERMNVYIEGTGRMEMVSMQQLGVDWKLGGFIRRKTK